MRLGVGIRMIRRSLVAGSTERTVKELNGNLGTVLELRVR